VYTVFTLAIPFYRKCKYTNKKGVPEGTP